MPDQLMLCTDLDRTLIPNGPQAESTYAHELFRRFVAQDFVVLVYVSGRDRCLIEKAIIDYKLPTPDYVIADVGTTLYKIDINCDWQYQQAWSDNIAQDWCGMDQHGLQQMIGPVTGLTPQELDKQNTYKLSYYAELSCDQMYVNNLFKQKLLTKGIQSRLIWSLDEQKNVNLLDVLPERASKYHAIEYLIKQLGFLNHNTIFCGDSGNDLEVLISPIPAVLVANSPLAVRDIAVKLARNAGTTKQLYLAQGEFLGMNGNYSAGILEGIAFYYPEYVDMLHFMVQDLGYEK